MSDSNETLGNETLTPLKRALIEIRGMRARIDAMEQARTEPIALVGIGCRFPGGVDSPEALWQLLRNGTDAITEVPPNRWDINAYFDADLAAPGKMTTRYGGFVRDIDHFDPGFFSIARREAEQMDPQQRLLLEVAWEALERASIAPDSLAGTDAGVFIGIANSDYFRMLASDLDQIDVYLGTGNATSVAAGRISYLLGLHGPSMSLDTACSSSLVAVHLACQSLRARECSLALAGGVNLILSPDININFSKAQMLSPDGRSKFGDASADGYVRGEGCGVVVLKRLSDAVIAGDPIIAVIRGSAINQDGRSSGLTAPNGPAQEAVLRAALTNAGLTPADIGYIEAHGTGTALGDPIELQALGAVFGPARPAGSPLPVGSLKTNLGHTEAAAGIAGLIKTALMLQHGAIPVSLHFNTPSALVSWKELALEVPTALRPWQPVDHLRRAGVSSFGFSGTNAHVLLEQAPEPVPATPATLRPLQLLPLSAKTAPALRELTARYIVTLTENPGANIADVCFTAAVGRAHYAQRLVIHGADGAAIRAGLSGYLEGVANPNVTTGDASGGQPEVVFLFTGHGSHYAGMGQALYASEPVFQAALDRCAALLQPHLDRPLQDILFSERTTGNPHPLDRMDYAQPALFALQYALAEQWRAWGVQPAAVAGHSAGEYVAAVVAGVLSLEDGLRLIVTRGKLMQQLPRDGAMVAIFADEATVAHAIKSYASAVSIAAINGPATTVISGQRVAVDAVLDDLALTDDDFRRLDISVAAHSPLVEPILDEFERAVAGVTLSTPQITLISSMTGQPIGDAITQPNYWRRHLRQPVRFADVFATLRASGYNTFVEMGPHPTLIGLGQRCWPDDSGTWVPSLRKDTNENEQMQAGIAALYVHGIAVNWLGVMGPGSHRKVALPTYPWQHERYWSPMATAAAAGARVANKIDAGAMWAAANAAAQSQAEQGPLDLAPTSYAARWHTLNQLADTYIIKAICELGLFQQAGERLSPADIASLGIALTYTQLIERWLGHLVEAGVLRRDADGSFIANAPLLAANAQAQIETLERDAATQFADSEPLLAYIRRCGERLAAVLTGAESALATLFPDGSYETVDFIYNRWAVARYFNGIARAATLAAAHAKPGLPFRVLEIGAGTGGTAAALLPALPADRTTYVFTDVSDFFRARAAERFAAHPFVRYGLLNIEQSPQEQGYAAHSFDVVVAANVLHATRDLNATLRHALDLLVPGGMLVLYETTNHPRWLDITTGLIEGWQRFDDQWRDDHPLLNAPRWEQALRANGFNEVLALPGAEASTAIFGQHIILARAPLGTHAPQAVREITGLGIVEFAVQVIADEPEPILNALAQALPDERHDVLVDFVRRAVARVLRSGDPQRLGRDQRLLDLGFDSLMAVELRNVLRQGLALEQKLPATLVFDHPTISAIASFLERMTAPTEPVTAGPINEIDSPAPSARSAEIADMTDEQVEALLMKRLEGI